MRRPFVSSGIYDVPGRGKIRDIDRILVYPCLPYFYISLRLSRNLLGHLFMLLTLLSRQPQRLSFHPRLLPGLMARFSRSLDSHCVREHVEKSSRPFPSIHLHISSEHSPMILPFCFPTLGTIPMLSLASDSPAFSFSPRCVEHRDAAENLCTT